MWDYVLEYSRTTLLHGMSHLWEQDFGGALREMQIDSTTPHERAGNTRGGHSLPGLST